jgi:hypothetical protein
MSWMTGSGSASRRHGCTCNSGRDCSQKLTQRVSAPERMERGGDAPGQVPDRMQLLPAGGARHGGVKPKPNYGGRGALVEGEPRTGFASGGDSNVAAGRKQFQRPINEHKQLGREH